MEDTVVDLVKLFIQGKINVHLWSAPGEGKTEFFEGYADILGWHCHVEPLNISDPLEVGGVMQMDGSRKPPAWAVELKRHLPKALLFLDELATCDESQMVSAMRIVQENRVGPLNIRGVSCAAASNPSDTCAGSGSGELPPPMANRFAHFDWELPGPMYDDYSLGGSGFFKSNPVLPADWEKHISWWQSMHVMFLQRHPEFRRISDDGLKKLMAESGAPAIRHSWASPRSWQSAVRAAAIVSSAYESDGPERKSQALVPALRSIIGANASLAFLEYVNDHQLPTGEQMLNGDAKWSRSWRTDQGISVLKSCCAAVHNEQDWEKLGRVIEDAIGNGQKESVATVLKDIAKAKQHSSWKVFPSLSNLLTVVSEEIEIV